MAGSETESAESDTQELKDSCGEWDNNPPPPSPEDKEDYFDLRDFDHFFEAVAGYFDYTIPDSHQDYSDEGELQVDDSGVQLRGKPLVYDGQKTMVII